MPTTQAYSHEQFISVPSGQNVNLPILRGAIAALVLTAPVSNVEPQRGGGALVSWEDLPVAADIAAVTAVVVAHTGLVTTGAPQQFSQLADVDAPSSTFVDVLNVQAQPAEAGTYLVLGATDLYMPAVVANTFIRAEFALQINGGAGATGTSGGDGSDGADGILGLYPGESGGGGGGLRSTSAGSFSGRGGDGGFPGGAGGSSGASMPAGSTCASNRGGNGADGAVVVDTFG